MREVKYFRYEEYMFLAFVGFIERHCITRSISLPRFRWFEVQKLFCFFFFPFSFFGLFLVYCENIKSIKDN